jgi:hypothetical protein
MLLGIFSLVIHVKTRKKPRGEKITGSINNASNDSNGSKKQNETRGSREKEKEQRARTAHTHTQPASRAGDRSSAPIRQYKSSIMVEEVAHKFCLIFYFIHFFFRLPFSNAKKSFLSSKKEKKSRRLRRRIKVSCAVFFYFFLFRRFQ